MSRIETNVILKRKLDKIYQALLELRPKDTGFNDSPSYPTYKFKYNIKSTIDKVPKGYSWEIIAGVVYHDDNLNGTSFGLINNQNGSLRYVWCSDFIQSGQHSGYYPIDPKTLPPRIYGSWDCWFSVILGTANAFMSILYIERKEDNEKHAW